MKELPKVTADSVRMIQEGVKAAVCDLAARAQCARDSREDDEAVGRAVAALEAFVDSAFLVMDATGPARVHLYDMFNLSFAMHIAEREEGTIQHAHGAREAMRRG
jgi:hypothetical protein